MLMPLYITFLIAGSSTAGKQLLPMYTKEPKGRIYSIVHMPHADMQIIAVGGTFVL